MTEAERRLAELESLLRPQLDRALERRLRRWSWLPAWRDALIVGLVVYTVALSVYVAVHRVTPTPPSRFDVPDPFSGQRLRCTLVVDGSRYDCTRGVP